MYCPTCGKSDQQPNSYCRQCGEYLYDLKKSKSTLSFGGETPQEQIRTNLFLNSMSAIVCIISAILLYTTFWNRGSEFTIVFLIAAFLLAVGGWQFSTFIVGLKLRKHFNNRINTNDSAIHQTNQMDLPSNNKTAELLPEADFSNVISSSITENTTKHLADKVLRKSSETEQ